MLDTKVYAGRHPEFPRTGTGDQFYGEFDFEAYRQLGGRRRRACWRGMIRRRRSWSTARWRADARQLNAFSPVSAWPMTSWWTSEVPS